ncbi:ABC transporter substrate-binding protein [Pedococcus sp. 5OH_020]|uniref:ABC transporter substrate-binding protein n=1 Tax=Pedococcus sp. 5OH_020 TaxID=2989814 RepID=UPI0022E9F1A4|nr:ABC transporter substrate-binding protein [Pedococcus sp. 5OH_020]
MVVDSIYDQLVTLTADFQAQPALAKSWNVNADATQWTLHLREGVKWHDGSDFSSKDVVYTINRMLDPKSGNHGAAFLSPYLDTHGVSAPDANTVVLKLKKPNGTLIQTIGNLPYASVVKDGVTAFGAKNSVGTGPFKLTGWTPGQGWKLARNDQYWGGAPYLDGIDASITPDQSAKVQTVLAGSTDLTDPIPVSLWVTMQGKSNVQLETVKNKNSWIFAFDQSQKPFDDPRVIQAIKLATDREKMVQTALQGHGKAVADVPIDPGTTWYPKGLKPEHDVAKAKSLLAEAGFPNGLDITLSTTAAVPGMLDAAQAWQQIVKGAGINVKLNQLPLDTYWTKGWMASSAFMDYWTSFFPPVGFGAFYAKDASYPETHHSDPTVEKTVAELMAATDPHKQIELTQQAYLAARDSYGFLIPVFADAAYARSPKVNGVIFNPATNFNFRKTWLA